MFATDGTQIDVERPPGQQGNAFHNRKSTTSINVLLAVDADNTIRYANTQWPGSTHDQRIYRQSTVCSVLLFYVQLYVHDDKTVILSLAHIFYI